MISTRSFRERLKNGEQLTGIFMQLGSSPVADIIAHSGFDWVVIDWEHGSFTTSDIAHCLDAMRDSPIVPIVRIPENSTTFIKYALDAGAAGIMVPMVMDQNQARSVVEASRYYPLGSRSYGGGRGSEYGRVADYTAQANENTLVIVQIEHRDAVANALDILSVPGVDLGFIGCYDLSISMGHGFDLSHPEVADAIGRVIEAGRESGVPLGIFARDREHAAECVKAGIPFVCHTTDTMLIASMMAEEAKKYV